jgi:DNA-binding transcriptional LysR family regulator
VRLAPQLRVGSSLVLRDLLIAGQGIGALPDFIAAAPERQGQLVRVLPQHVLPSRHVYAVTASRQGMDTKVSAFLDHLQATLER